MASIPHFADMALDESELRRLVGALDEALEVFNHHEKRLTAREIRLRSYLAVMRQEAMEQLLEFGYTSGLGEYTMPGHDEPAPRPHL